VVLVFGVIELSIFIGSSPNDTSLIENKDIIQQGRETPGTSQQTQNEIFSELNQIKQSKNVTAEFVLFIIFLSLAANIILVLIIIKILKKENERIVRYEKFSVLGELAARIAHDLRNPLFVMQSSIKILFTKHSFVAESVEMQLLSKSIFKMEHLINDVLNFLRSQRLEMKLTSFTQIVLDSIEGHLLPSNIKIVLPDTDKIVYCDPLQLQRVVSNIIQNAVAAISEEHGVIVIKFSENSDFVICQIIDSGPGIEKENIIQKNVEAGISTVNLDDQTKWFSLIREPSILADQDVQDNTKKHIPSGIKKEANFWANGILSDHEFAKSIQYLSNAGFLTTSKSIEKNLATVSEVIKNNNIAPDFTKASDEEFIFILDFLLEGGLINEVGLLENTLTLDETLQEIDLTLKNTLKGELASYKQELIDALISWNENGKKLDINLFQLIISSDPNAEAKRLGLIYKDGKTKAVVEISENKPELLSLLQAIGRIDFISDKYVQMNLDLNKLSDLVEINEVQKVRIPYVPTQHEFQVSRGVEFVNADLVQFAGITGRGVKVAVIDFAFDSENSKISPNIAYAKSFRLGIDNSPLPLSGLELEQLHGTAVAELIVDTAPNAKLFLYSIGNELEFVMALKDAIENKIDIITIPLGWANLPTDGTSYLSNNVNTAAKEGIIVVVPSGNFAISHWEGKYVDENSNGWHEFTVKDEGLTFNITQERIKKKIPLIVNLLWDNDNAATMDFDMLLINPSNKIVSFSANVQNAQSDTTFEQIRYIPSEAGTYSLGIIYDGSHKNPRTPIEIFSINDELEHYVTVGSVIVPADADNIIVTGAVNVESGEIEPFSSQGPTNHGYAVPHVLAPNGVSTIAYGDKLFYGTSAAAPYVAGIAALVLEIDPTMSLEEILKNIKENTIPQSSDSSIYCDKVGQCGLIDAELIVPWEKIR